MEGAGGERDVLRLLRERLQDRRVAVALIHGPIRGESYCESIRHVRGRRAHSRIGREHVDVHFAFHIPDSVRANVIQSAFTGCIFEADLRTLPLLRHQKRPGVGDNWSSFTGQV